MLRLAQKAFHPGPIPFPLLHVDTTLQVPGNDRVPRLVHGAASALRLIVHTNQRGRWTGRNPFAWARSAAAGC